MTQQKETCMTPKISVSFHHITKQKYNHANNKNLPIFFLNKKSCREIDVCGSSTKKLKKTFEEEVHRYHTS